MKHKNQLRAAVVIILLAAVIGLFSYYIDSHPGVVTILSHINPYLLILLLFLYGLMLLIWMGVYNAILALCGTPLAPKENMLLSIYSTLANFFLPLQSGPGIRAGYLKSKHHVPVSAYVMSSLIYFGFYALIAAAFMFVFSSYWWLSIPAIILVAGVSAGVIYLARQRFQRKGAKLTLLFSAKKLWRLFLLTLSQLVLQTIIYGTELKSLDLHFNLFRAFSYTGAASFSLFVSLTPGAIGFREAFLKLSQSLHHFSTNDIVSANLVDRGIFLIFLAILFVIMLITHAKDKIKV